MPGNEASITPVIHDSNNPLMKIKQYVHSYKGYSGVDSSCRMTVYRTATDMTVVLVDELPTNTGTSAKEFVEHLATQAYREVFGTNDSHVGSFMYIEHAPAAEQAGAFVYNRVDFDWDDQGLQFIHPEYIEMTVDEVREFVEDESLN